MWGFIKFSIISRRYRRLAYCLLLLSRNFLPHYWGGSTGEKVIVTGYTAGLIGGITIWVITMMTQTGMLAGTAETNVLLWLLTPPSLPILEVLTTVDWGMLLSLMVNISLYVLVSVFTRSSLTERLQAATFVGAPLPETDDVSLYQSRVTVGELEMLAARFVGRKRARKAFRQFSEQHRGTLTSELQASAALIRHTERVLAGRVWCVLCEGSTYFRIKRSQYAA